MHSPRPVTRHRMPNRLRESIFVAARTQVPLRLDAVTHGRLTTLCDQRAVSISVFVSELLTNSLQRSTTCAGMLSGLRTYLPRRGESGPRRTVTVRLPSDAHAAAQERLAGSQVSFNAFMTALVAATLTRELPGA